MMNIKSRVQKLEEAEGIGNEKPFWVRRVDDEELKRIYGGPGDRPMLALETRRGIAVLVPMKEGTY